MIRFLATLFASLFGLAMGSFLNVCLSRWPEGESIVQPRSHCRNCAHTLSWWENVPLLSWLLLRGRCRTCKEPIGGRYPLVEAAVGGLWAIFVARALPDDAALITLPPSALVLPLLTALAAMLLAWFLVALAALDAENLWLPDWLTIPGAVLGFLLAALHPVLLLGLDRATGLPLADGLESGRFGLLTPAIYRLFAIAVAAGAVLLIRWVYQWVRKREGLGLGDAKLMALLTAWLGLPGAVLAFVIGVALGTLAALAVLLKPRREGEPWSQMKLPLGTFLCLGGLVSCLWGKEIIALYWQLAGF